MNERVKNLIVDALRNGNYKQTFGVCHSKNCFCFTGLVLDLYRKDTGDGEWRNDVFYHSDGTYSSTQVQSQVWKWLGIEDNIPDYGLAFSYENKERYWSDNDNGVTFDRLAKTVEKHGICVPSN